METTESSDPTTHLTALQQQMEQSLLNRELQFEHLAKEIEAKAKAAAEKMAANAAELKKVRGVDSVPTLARFEKNSTESAAIAEPQIALEQPVDVGSRRNRDSSPTNARDGTRRSQHKSRSSTDIHGYHRRDGGSRHRGRSRERSPTNGRDGIRRSRSRERGSRYGRDRSRSRDRRMRRSRERSSYRRRSRSRERRLRCKDQSSSHNHEDRTKLKDSSVDVEAGTKIGSNSKDRSSSRYHHEDRTHRKAKHGNVDIESGTKIRSSSKDWMSPCNHEDRTDMKAKMKDGSVDVETATKPGLNGKDWMSSRKLNDIEAGTKTELSSKDRSMKIKSNWVEW
ncbi:hypothetical protein LINPERHAP2_LOCUS43169 [Linum perenne]